MTPERRARAIEALREISDLFWVPREGGGASSLELGELSDAALTAMLVNVEALLERAQGTDI